MSDIKTKGEEAKEMGLDLKEYALYVISQEFIDSSKDKEIKEFVKELRVRIEDDLDAGWQESSKRDVFIKDIKQILQELVLRDYKERLTVKDFPKFLNRLVDIITKNSKGMERKIPYKLKRSKRAKGCVLLCIVMELW